MMRARAARSGRAPSRCAWRSISASSSSRCSSAPVGQLARERLRVGEQLVERPPGDLALVEREDGGAALVGCGAREAARQAPRDVLAGAGVDPDPVALVDEQRHLDLHARLERGRLRAAAGGRVAAEARVGLGDRQLDGARDLEAGGRSSTNSTSTSSFGSTQRIASPATGLRELELLVVSVSMKTAASPAS